LNDFYAHVGFGLEELLVLKGYMGLVQEEGEVVDLQVNRVGILLIDVVKVQLVADNVVDDDNVLDAY
jgi:hypothetical protein